MPFCPRCRTEYRPGFTLCADCQVELVDQLEELPAKDSQPNDAGKASWAFLISVYNDVEADLVAGLLTTCGIPTTRAYPGMGTYAKIYFGSSLGVDLYVPAEKLEEARSILGSGSRTKRRLFD
jgi:hypothetical protein